MKNKLFLVFAFLLLFLNIKTQTVISANIDFNDQSQSHILITNNGDQFLGQIINIQNNIIHFKLRNLDSTSSFNFSEVKFLGVKGEKRTDYVDVLDKQHNNESPAERFMPSNRLLYHSSALPYRGHGSYRNTMLFWNDIDFQIGNYFSLGVSSIVPALISIQGQAKISLSDYIHTGINTQEYIILFDTESVNHSYLNMTFGDYDKYINLSYGFWTNRSTSFFDGQKRIETNPTAGLGGSYDFGNGWRFYIDALIYFDDFDTMIFPSFNLSRLKRKSMFEIGLASIPDSGIPIIPIVSYNVIFK